MMKPNLRHYGFLGALSGISLLGLFAASAHLLPKTSALRSVCVEISSAWTFPLVRFLDAVIPEPLFGHDSFFSNPAAFVVYLVLYALLTGWLLGMLVYLAIKISSKKQAEPAATAQRP